MNLEVIIKYCFKKKGVWEDFPFDDVTMVIKVGSKMYALISFDKQPLRMNLKCDPLVAQGLREKYKAVIPGYHMNKEHWNTITLDGSIPDNVVFGMIDDSYELVFEGLRKSEKEEIKKSL